MAIALVSLVISVYKLIENSRSYVIDARVEFNENRKLIEDQIKSLNDSLDEEIKSIRSSLKRFEEFEAEINLIKRRHKNNEPQAENMVNQNPKPKKD